ncbi:MAG: L-serine ammonia-lyase, iron-sulfur-dependent, subunit beta [Firmicutes bacterium]|nr:L-serine ammonia-lyase, iron-sulfur-dependent, subunit beta [Bacillota bacterium]
MGVFDIIGPVMIGPSSSHTAGAARLGKMARAILGEKPVSAIIGLYGSFARNHKGHGTDKALVAGMLGMSADDTRIKDALILAGLSGMRIAFETRENSDVHPNTAEFNLVGASGRKVRVIGASVGGGRIIITRINDYQVEITGDYNTLIVMYKDEPGIVARITQILARENVNIAFMRVSRRGKGGQAMMILELDQPLPDKALIEINSTSSIESAIMVHML